MPKKTKSSLNHTRTSTRPTGGGFFLTLLILLTGLGFSAPPEAAEENRFVGAASCRDCHEKEFNDWQSSHHHMAMAEPTSETVVGDFDDAEFTHFGRSFRFFQKDGKYIVNAEDKDGERKDWEVAYTFGIYPLQQYLLPAEGGRLQALQVCWDARPVEEGGQRWYHLYPDEEIPPDDVLHWTGQHFNWNYMCADCHSTDLQKNFDHSAGKAGVYDTQWAEMNVSCEACHGPGSGHVDWAEALATDWTREGYSGDMGLAVRLKEEVEAGWMIDPETGQPKRTTPLASNVQVETCAPCHSHRRILQDGSSPHGTGSLLNGHVPSVLEQVLYHPDGQIKEEVYVHGSFIQSKMFHTGVRCTDCHDPHTARIYTPENALCVRCHTAEEYDSKAHHFHEMGSTGAKCVDCHMPGKFYMGVDWRRDHSLRVPRPDLSDKLGTPNACTSCHEDQTNQWAADFCEEWYPDSPHRKATHYGEILAAAQHSEDITDLAALAGDEAKPDLVRATALDMIAQRPATQTGVNALALALRDDNPLVRQAGMKGFGPVDAKARVSLLAPMLTDPVKAVRLEATRALAATSPELFDAEQRNAFETNIPEFIAAQMALNDRAGGHMGLALFYTDQGDLVKAEASYRDAIRIEPDHIPSHVNLAELCAQQGRLEDGVRVLEQAVLNAPNSGLAHESLGRFYVRAKDYPKGLESLGKAAQLQPQNAATQFFYGVAANSLGQFERALPPLQQAHALQPDNVEYLVGLATICRDNKRLDLARSYAEKLLVLQPENPQFQGLLRSLSLQGSQ